MVAVRHEDWLAPDMVYDPYAYFSRVRTEMPVHWNERHRTWVVTRYRDVVWLLRHPEWFSSAVFQHRPFAPKTAEPDAQQALYTRIQSSFTDMLIQQDRPMHTALRRAIHGFFTPNAIARWRPGVQSIVAALIDRLEPQGAMDFRRDVATPMTLLVMARLLGLPDPDDEALRSLSDKLLLIARWRFLQHGQDGRPCATATAIEDLHRLLTPLIEARTAAPQDDLLSLFAQAEHTGILSRQQVLANVMMLLMAGHETSINLVCNGVLALLQHPEQWAALIQAPQALAQPATEECLRYEPPVKSLRRIATQDLELAGQRIRQGEEIRWVIAAANRDPLVFDRPDQFDVTRTPNPHLGFGTGIHHCLGVGIARMEGQETLWALAQRLPTLRLQDGPLTYQPSLTFRALTALPVTWMFCPA
jgi:pimeloyl-[acyl-carrier protein] synthase